MKSVFAKLTAARISSLSIRNNDLELAAMAGRQIKFDHVTNEHVFAEGMLFDDVSQPCLIGDPITSRDDGPV